MELNDMIRLSDSDRAPAPAIGNGITPSTFTTGSGDDIDVRMNLPIYFLKGDLIRTFAGMFQVTLVRKESLEVVPVARCGVSSGKWDDHARVWVKAGARHLVRCGRAEHITDRDTCLMYAMTTGSCTKSTMHTSRAFHGLDPTEIVNEEELDYGVRKAMCQAACDAAWTLAMDAEKRGEPLGAAVTRVAIAKQCLDDCRVDAPGYKGR